MKLGNSLFHARKKFGISQETVAEKLEVSRQTVSKWETDETLPDICRSKQMALLYNRHGYNYGDFKRPADGTDRHGILGCTDGRDFWAAGRFDFEIRWL